MSSPIALFAPLGALPGPSARIMQAAHTAQEPDGVAPPSLSAELGWSATPQAGAAHHPMDRRTADINAGIALVQTAGAALDRVADALRGMRALAHRAGTATADERPALEQQFKALGAAALRVLEDTQSDGRSIFGEGAGSTTFRIGTNGALQAVTRGAQASLTEPRVVPPAPAEHLEQVIEQLDLATAHVADEREALATAELHFGTALGEILNAAQNGLIRERTLSDADDATSAAHALSRQIRQSPGAAMFALGSPAPLRVLGLLALG